MEKREFVLKRELEELSLAVCALRVPGKKLLLPDDLKLRVCRLWKSGVSFAEIRRFTRIQSVTIRGWERNRETVLQKRPFQILKIAPDVEKGSVLQTPAQQQENFKSVQKPLVFRYERVVLEIVASQLTADLMRILVQC
jgi:hypothetical protein